LLGDVAGEKDFPALSLSTNGGYVTWTDNRIQEGREGKGIAAAALNSLGEIHGLPFRVSQQTEGKQEHPQVVSLTGGGPLFLWEMRHGSKAGIYSRILGTNGTFAFGDQLVSVATYEQAQKQTTNWTAYYRGVLKPRTHKFKEIVTHTREQAGAISAVALPDGGAMLAYHAMRRADTNSWGLVERTYMRRGESIKDSKLRPYRVGADYMHDIFLQRLDSSGRKMGAEILANQNVSFNQRTPSVALLSDGNLVIVWVSETETRQTNNLPANFRVNLVWRRFDAQGQPLGDELSVTPPSQAVQANPVVSALSGGGFMVLWSQQEANGRGWDVFAQTHATDGSAAGSAFRVNNFTTGDQFAPSVATAGDQQLVVWTSVGQDGSREGVYGRRLQAGALAGDEFRINQTTPSRQWHPTVAADGQDGAVVLWSGFAGVSGFDLFGGRVALNPNPSGVFPGPSAN
jgi:hypothetical protein